MTYPPLRAATCLVALALASLAVVEAGAAPPRLDRHDRYLAGPTLAIQVIGERWTTRPRDGRLFRFLAKPGSYRVRATPPTGDPTTRAVRVPAGAVRRLTLRLEASKP